MRNFQTIKLSPFLKDIVLTTITSIVVIISMIFVTRLLATGLGPEGFGAYCLARRIVSFIIPFSTLSMGVALTRYVAISTDDEKRNGHLVSTTVIVLCFSCLACGVIGYGINVWMEKDEIIDPEPAAPAPPVQFSYTLEALLNTEVPINDPIDIAQRLEGKENIPLTLPVENLNRQVGEKETFWVTDTDTAINFQVETTLAAVTDHLYFWIEDGVDYSEKALGNLAAEFEDNIYPTNQEFFGSEWTPGVDEDPHL